MGLTGEEWRGINQYMILSSREGFRSIVEGLDLTTNAGREAYVAMLNLSDIADQYYSELEEQQQKAADLANDRRSMEIKIMELEGKASEAVAAQRQIELNALDETLRPLQERIYALQDEKTAAEAAAEAAQKEAQALEEAAAKAAAIAKQRRGIEIDIMEASGLTAEATAARRADELAELDESLRPLKMRYYALLDEQAAMEAAKEAERARSTAMQKASDDAAEYAEKMEDLRDIFRRVDPAGVRFAETLATIAGNLDELTSSMQTYYDEFFSDKEKRSILKGELTSALSGYGLSLPGSRGDYRELIESMDKDTSYGLRAYAALIEQVKKADTYYDYLDSARSQIKEGDYSSRLEYQRAIYGFADGGISSGPESGYFAQLHGTELIVSPRNGYPATVNANNAELVAEIKELKNKVAELTVYARRTEDNTRKSKDIHDEWNEIGVPLQS
jgi:chromosome segregation ATPase